MCVNDGRKPTVSSLGKHTASEWTNIILTGDSSDLPTHLLLIYMLPATGLVHLSELFDLLINPRGHRVKVEHLISLKDN